MVRQIDDIDVLTDQIITVTLTSPPLYSGTSVSGYPLGNVRSPNVPDTDRVRLRLMPVPRRVWSVWFLAILSARPCVVG